VYPSILAQGNRRLRCHRLSWPALHQVLRYRSSGLGCIRKSFTALYYARLRRVWRCETIAFAVSAEFSWYSIKTSGIDLAASYASADRSSRYVMHISVEWCSKTTHHPRHHRCLSPAIGSWIDDIHWDRHREYDMNTVFLSP
jgi:hypothetical protein